MLILRINGEPDVRDDAGAGDVKQRGRGARLNVD